MCVRHNALSEGHAMVVDTLCVFAAERQLPHGYSSQEDLEEVIAQHLPYCPPKVCPCPASPWKVGALAAGQRERSAKSSAKHRGGQPPPRPRPRPRPPTAAPPLATGLEALWPLRSPAETRTMRRSGVRDRDCAVEAGGRCGEEWPGFEGRDALEEGSPPPPEGAFKCPRRPSSRFVTASSCRTTAFPAASSRFCRCSGTSPSAPLPLPAHPWLEGA